MVKIGLVVERDIVLPREMDCKATHSGIVASAKGIQKVAVCSLVLKSIAYP